MSDTVIKVKGLGKKYTLGMTLSHDTLRDQIAHAAKRIMSGIRQSNSIGTTEVVDTSDGKSDIVKRPKEFWALKDINFVVKRGEILGVIGHNGAGKSTLLKILSKITEPTEGEVRLRGRVGSLLEVGTGMHPELSGRENVYLNGAILGMGKKEIDQKYNQIVDFAGIHDFMGTPIKRYSSGMRVRLGFSIAAHLEPEILIIDEVLAVGDAEFQKKCLGKMKDVATKGRTVLFVSHNMGAIRQLCSRGILIDHGKTVFDEAAQLTVEKYMNISRPVCRNQFTRTTTVNPISPIQVEDVRIEPEQPKTGLPLKFSIVILVKSQIKCEFAIAISNSEQQPLLIYYSNNDGQIIDCSEGRQIVTVTNDYFPLIPGEYNVNIWTGLGNHPFDWQKSCMVLDVIDGRLGNSVDFAVRNTQYPVVPPATWESIFER